jgi:F-type H+-transporting ATPase subunit a
MAAHSDPSAFDHVQDATTWELFPSLFGKPVEIELPKIFGFQVTKFMVLELLAAVLVAVIYIPIAKRARTGELPKGAWWNAFESLLTFIRNDVVRPTIGEKYCDHYVPFFWTLFLFLLFNNLLGMVPLLGSPTASIWMTGGLALCSFVLMHGASIVDRGAWGYFSSQWPHIEIVPFPGRPAGHGGHDHGHGHDHDHGHEHAPVQETPAEPVAWHQWLTWGAGFGFGLLISGMIFIIEMFGTVIKSGVLAVRLFANMFAGHMVLATILIFIYLAGKGGPSVLWGGVTIASVLGNIALSLLELFVAFLQAYIFTFLTALFTGMALHPEH